MNFLIGVFSIVSAQSVIPLENVATSFVLNPNPFGPNIEGASVDAAGTVYAVDFRDTQFQNPNSAVGSVFPKAGLAFGKQGTKVDTLLNGARFLKDGSAIIVDAVAHKVYNFKSSSSFTEICGGAKFLQPNDLAITKSEKYVYFSGQNFTATTFPTGQSGDIWLCDRERGIVKNVGLPFYSPMDIHRTNGIEVSPNDQYLYVSSASNFNGTVLSNQIIQFQINQENGDLGQPRVLIDFGMLDKTGDVDIDGMRTDIEGNLYVTRNGAGKVTILSPTGELKGTIKLPTISNPTNLEFGGTNGKTLVIVGKCAGNLTSSCINTWESPIAGKAITYLREGTSRQVVSTISQNNRNTPLSATTNKASSNSILFANLFWILFMIY
ncbi:hypothetical protein BC833DRAFT_599100 [Globomyces pollinis-pini]|nr:hypothetical protein BC833DRAFT_599100 [Globomyces pollinis-pini]